MVIGLKAKNYRGPTVQVDYLVHILEIKPWPPSQSLKSLRSVLIQWENGDRSSGLTNAVVPSIGGEGRIEFNESFKLPVTLLRDVAVKGGVKGGGEGDAFLKNCLELNLYEPRRDKTAKGQLLATTIVDLAEYGVLKECISVSAPMNSKRTFKNTDKPILYMKIQPFKKGHTSSSSKDSLSRGVSLDKAGVESVSALMDEEYADEAEKASFTDDDVSSHSSQTVSSSLETSRRLSLGKDETAQHKLPNSTEGDNAKQSLASNLGTEKSRTAPQDAPLECLKGSSSCSSSVDLSSDPGSPVNGHTPVIYSHSSSSTVVIKAGGPQIVSSSSSSSLNDNAEESNTTIRSNDHPHAQEVIDKAVNVKSNTSVDIQYNSKDDKKSQEIGRDPLEGTAAGEKYDRSIEDKDRQKQEENGDERNSDEENQSGEGEGAGHANGKPVPLGMNETIVSNEKLKPVKSVRSIADLSKSTLSRNDQHVEVNDVFEGDTQKSAGIAGNFRVMERREVKVYPKDTRSVILESKVNQLEQRIKMLEGELREAAAVESALYSVVAEHGSSMSKVHAPARRLSRLYLHACGETSRSRRASATKSVVSGLVLVAKACGNDVPRLTFWLSNSIVLRTIISQATGDPELPKSARSSIDRNGAEKVKCNASSPLKWEAPSSGKIQGMKLLNGSFGDWENPNAFMSTLEKIESWIFSRIVESIWWQTLTPHMQSAATKAIDENIGSGSRKRTSSSVDQEQNDFSLDLWKKAFRDACERLCPVRAGGHECGCLPLLSRLVMEQSVARLDVAMFNAILRESCDEIPTDPVSDPISDSKVLPIPAGTSSFGAGAQLKSVIGNWSRWLTDLFGIDDDDAFEDVNGHDDNDERHDTSFKSFHLLNALSDLMMLPKDMLLSKSIRKEVCPTFAAPLIKRILDNFVPDEFCTDPIPDIVLETLESEDTFEIGEEALTNVPCTGPGTVYLPPSTSLVASMIGDSGGQSQLRSGSSVVRKSHTSDDELDELNSPLASIFIGSSASSPVASKLNWVPKGNINQNAVRYELLRDIWMNSE